MSNIREFIEKNAAKDTTIQTEEGQVYAMFFDWKELVVQDMEIFKKAQSMSKESQSDFLSHSKCWTTDLFEYYCDSDVQEKIENEEWLPIAVLGLTYLSDSIAEMHNKGLVAIVIKGGEYPEGSVLWFDQNNDEQIQLLADSIDELEVTLNTDEDTDEDSDDSEEYRHLEPPYEDLWNSSLAHCRKKDYDSSLKDLMQIHKSLPQNVAVLRALAQLAGLKEDFCKALEYAEIALNIEPRNISLLTTKGKLLMNMGKFVDAQSIGVGIEELGKADNDDSDAAKGTALRAICLVRMGMTAEAKPLLLEAEEKGSFLNITFDDFEWAKTEVGLK